MDILSPRWCTSDLVTGMKGFYRGIRARGCRRALPRIALEGALPGELVRELTPPPPAWVTSPHHHAPSGREVDGALSRPSPKRNGAPNTVPDYRAPCTPGTAFRFVKGRCESCYQSSALVSSHIRAPRHLHRLVCECLSATKGERGRGRIDSDRKIPERHLRLWTGWPAT